jgi:hypothetical protein
MPGVRYRALAGMTRSIGIIYREARGLSHAGRALGDFLRDGNPGRAGRGRATQNPGHARPGP